MNSLKGVIEQVEVNGNLSLVNLKVGECNFKSIVIETPETAEYLRIGNTVDVLFKETEALLQKQFVTVQQVLSGLDKHVLSARNLR